MGSGNDHPTEMKTPLAPSHPSLPLPLGLSGNKPLALSSAITTDGRSLIDQRQNHWSGALPTAVVC
jgi:hypothetical protein